MRRCSRCGTLNKSTAKFCTRCGATLPQGPWLSLDHVIHHRYRSMSLMGAGLTLVGGFLPWADFGIVATAAPAAAGLFLMSILAAALMFHSSGGLAAMVIGGICGLTAVFALLGNPSSTPSMGLLLSLVGGGLIAYGGYQIKA